MTRRILSLIFAVAALFCFKASAQTADELVKKNIEARG